ncbi:MAG: acetyl-CoA carboxylase biotin carboxyl carrier protein subunit [Dehalococcoidia bacterium]
MDIPSPVPGVVKEILAAPGDAVSEYQELLILESMKMEIPVEAPVAGTLVELLVAEGAQVVENQLLGRIAPAT